MRPPAIGTAPFFVSGEIEDVPVHSGRPFTESLVEPQFSWIGSPHLAGVSDQRPHNTCAAHALSRAHETMRRQQGLPDLWFDADQFHQCVLGLHPSAGVTDIVAAVRTFSGTGAPTGPSAFQAGGPCPSTPRPLVKCAGAKRVPDAEAAKQTVAELRPIMALMTAEQRFLAVDDFSAYRDGADPKTFHHAILIVGFDEREQCWEVQNSMGTAWGAQGRGRIAYGHASLFADRDHVGFVLN